jgi:NADH:ubiquinone reductase (H+-translocating)
MEAQQQSLRRDERKKYMQRITKCSFFIEGQLAKLTHWALHKQHQLALGGFWKTALITLSEMIDRTHRPRIKLH